MHVSSLRYVAIKYDLCVHIGFTAGWTESHFFWQCVNKEAPDSCSWQRRTPRVNILPVLVFKPVKMYSRTDLFWHLTWSHGTAQSMCVPFLTERNVRPEKIPKWGPRTFFQSIHELLQSIIDILENSWIDNILLCLCGCRKLFYL